MQAVHNGNEYCTPTCRYLHNFTFISGGSFASISSSANSEDEASAPQQDGNAPFVSDKTKTKIVIGYKNVQIPS